MAHTLVGTDGKTVEIGAQFDLYSNKQMWIVAGVVPPNAVCVDGAVLVTHSKVPSTLTVSAHEIDAIFLETPDVDPRRSKDGMSFGTAAHEFKFKVGERVCTCATSNVTFTVLNRLYDSGDGDPYYFVHYEIDGRHDGKFLEKATVLERRYAVPT